MGTAFTYQGRLTDTSGPMTGNCDFQFKLFNAASGGTQIGGTQTLTGVAVSEGLFTVQLDFGAGAFNGYPRWLGISVRCPAGSGDYVTLGPRQELTPVPYALYAASAPGDGDTTYQAGTGLTLSGTTFSVASTYRLPQECKSGQVAKWDGSGWVCRADKTGGGNAWLLTGNAGTSAGTNFVGTTDDQPLELHVDGQRALRLEPATDSTYGLSPNVIGGQASNEAAEGVYGATIGGGCYNTASGSHTTVGGGWYNSASGQLATVGGGSANTASGRLATVSGGVGNTAGKLGSFVGGGEGNTASRYRATVSGGLENTASGDSAIVGGGTGNKASGENATVGGGFFNDASGEAATVSGGDRNIASGENATVPGGRLANASHFGQLAYASGMFATWGDAQMSVYVLRRPFFAKNAGELFLDGDFTSQRLTIADGQSLAFQAVVVARRSDGATHAWGGQGVIKNAGGTVTLLGSSVGWAYGDSGVGSTSCSGWTSADAVDFAADTGNNSLAVKVCSEANVRWVATIYATEVAWVAP
jgi:hypothetical protein